MDVKYWNDFADEYDELVTDAFSYGRLHTIATTIENYASPELDAADYGCGPGKILPLLSQKFRHVYAYDFSNKLLDIARRRCEKLKNVEIAQADLSKPVDNLPVVDLIVTLNAIIMPDAKLRLQFMQGMASRIKPGGHLIMNVPSVESLLYSAFRETEWYRKEQGHTPKKAEFQTDISSLTGPRMLAQGIMYRGTEPTKHYLREELVVLVRDEMKLDLIDIVKMEYDWATDFEDDNIPDWMGEPYPWDWLVIAKAKQQTL